MIALDLTIRNAKDWDEAEILLRRVMNAARQKHLVGNDRGGAVNHEDTGARATWERGQ